MMTGRRAGGRRMAIAVRLTAAAGALALTAAGCRPNSDARAEVSDQRVVSIGTENITIAELQELSAGPMVAGAIAAEIEATLRAEVAGPVVQVVVQQGDRVRRGQLLVRIDDTSLREALLSAQSGMRSAESAVQLARRDAERMRTLQQGGAVSLRDVEATDRALVAAEAAFADARARLTMARQQLARTRIVAPFNGMVSEQQVSAGDVVQPGSALLTVVNPARMRLEANVPVHHVDALRTGTPVSFTVAGYEGRVFHGQVDRINPTADAASRQVRVYVRIPNDAGTLVSGLYAQGRVATEVRAGVTVPIRAVDETGLRPTVVRLKDGRAEVVSVELGLRDDRTERVEIIGGLAAGDTILLGSAAGIVPGTVVRVLSEAEQRPR